MNTLVHIYVQLDGKNIQTIYRQVDRRITIYTIANEEQTCASYPKSSRSNKWNNILKNIWENRKDYEGSGVIVIPSGPNTLLERLDLLLASQEAGHTGVGYELISICDELKRQGVLDTKTYKKLNSIIKNDSP